MLMKYSYFVEYWQCLKKIFSCGWLLREFLLLNLKAHIYDPQVLKQLITSFGANGVSLMGKERACSKGSCLWLCKDLLWFLKGVITAAMPCGEFGMAWPNWQVGALSSVLIKPGFFLRKRLILRQAGRRADRHAASRLWIGLHSEGTCLGSNLASLCLLLQTWQTHDYLTPGRVLSALSWVHVSQLA